MSLGRRVFWAVQLAGWTAYGMSTFLATLPNLQPGQYWLMLGFKTVRTAIGLVASLALWRLLRRFDPGQPAFGRVAARAVAWSSLLGIVWLLLYWQATVPFRPPELPPVAWPAFPRAAVDHVFVLLLWSALYIALRVFVRQQEDARTAFEAQARAREAELQMLRYQLNPHFLFNALNSVRAAIPLSSRMARDMVDELSDFLRHTLHARPGGTVQLSEELGAASSYLALEAVRFADLLETRFDVPPEAESVAVPVFVLHPLIENAVKHGIASDARPLRVVLRARVTSEGELVIEVTNSLGSRRPDRRPDLRVGFGLGLENVRRRLALAYGDQASCELSRDNGQARVRLRLPTSGAV